LTSNWRKIFTRVFTAAKIENGKPHRFRHTFAKWLLAKGVPIGFVAAALGDSEEIVRKHYAVDTGAAGRAGESYPQHVEWVKCLLRLCYTSFTTSLEPA
jgi:integrase